jgi:hypothetical protein
MNAETPSANGGEKVAKQNTPEVNTITIGEFDAAKYLGISVSFLRKARMDGDRESRTPGPAFIKIGRAVKYTLADLDAWIAANRHGGQAV